MGFGQEMKDFVEGYKTGEDIKDKRETQRLNRSRYGSATDDPNLESGASPLSGGTAPGIPETSGGGDGKVDNDTAQIAGRLKGDLMRDFGLNDIGAGGVVASLAAESGGFRQLQELNPTVKGSKGGWGYAQWTGPRRDAFNKFAQEYGLDPKSYEANYGFLKQELQGPEGKWLEPLKGAKTVREATQLFTGSAAEGKGFLRPGTPNMAGRFSWADRIAGIEPITRDTGPQIAQGPEDVQKRVAAAKPAVDPALAATEKPTDAKAEKTAALSPDAGIPMPEEATQFAQIEQPIVKPEDEWGNQTVFAASGGVIPEPQHFETGGQPYVPEPNPDNPSNAANGGDKYSRFRNYTQPIAASPSPAASAAPRISFPTAAPAATGPSPSQLAFAQLRAARPVAAPAPVAAAPVAAAPVAKKVAKPVSGSNMVYAPGGGGSGQQQFVQLPMWRGPNRNWAEGGIIPEPEQYYARGGKVDPDAHFKELIRQESRQRSQHSDDGGESPRDRAARRISAEKGKASSTAYKMHNEYWAPAKPKGGGGKPKTDKTETSSTTPHVRHPPNPKVGKPEIEEDRKTRFRESELVPGPSSVRPAREVGNDPRGTPDPLKPAIPVPDEDRTTRFRESELVPGPSSTRRLEQQGPPMGARELNTAAGTPLAPSPMPVAAGTDTRGYEPPTGNFPPRPPIPIEQQSGTPRQRYDEEIRQSVPSLTSPPPALPEPPEGPAQPRPAPAPPARPADPERTARDVGQRRKEMELVQTPPPQVPSANKLVPVLLNPDTGELHDPASADDGEYPDVPPQDWSSVNDRRPELRDTIMRNVLNPTGRRLLGYASGGVIPEPGETGYNEAVGEANAAPAPAAEAAPPVAERHQATPKLLSDVATALHHGAQFLTQHFGLSQQGAVPTPEGQQASQDGARRFAEGEGATTPQEIQAIDDKIDPDRQMSEGDRQMTRSAKIVQWYLERGRKEDASAAAAGLMQYGAQRFSQIGSIAAAAYRKGDVEGTLNALKSAYQYIPDGGGMDIAIDPKTNKIVATHTDEEGNETDVPVKPEDLPNIIRSVQDKSAYWQQVMTLADPEGQHIKQRDAASKSEWNRQHVIERGEKLTDADAAAKAEAAKNDRELKEKIDAEKRAAETKAAEHEQTLKEGTEKEKRESAEHDRQALFAAGIARAAKIAEGDTSLDSAKLGNLTGAVYAAKNAEDAETPEGIQRINEAYSRLQDALPQTDVTKRTELFKKLTNETAPTDFQYIPAGKFLEATGDTPPADYPGKQADDKVQKGTDKNTGKPIWVIIRDGKQYSIPSS